MKSISYTTFFNDFFDIRLFVFFVLYYFLLYDFFEIFSKTVLQILIA